MIFIVALSSYLRQKPCSSLGRVSLIESLPLGWSYFFLECQPGSKTSSMMSSPPQSPPGPSSWYIPDVSLATPTGSRHLQHTPSHEGFMVSSILFHKWDRNLYVILTFVSIQTGGPSSSNSSKFFWHVLKWSWFPELTKWAIHALMCLARFYWATTLCQTPF